MRKIFNHVALSIGALALCLLAGGSARADIVYLGQRIVQPSGQGVVTTVLTLQDKNDPQNGGSKDGTETGAVRYNPNDPDAGKFGARNGDVLVDDAKPGTNSKTWSLTELNSMLKQNSLTPIQNAADLGIYLDIGEPGQGNFVTLQSLVLTAYLSNGTSVDFSYTGGPINISQIGQGGGKSDAVFGLDSAQAAQLQALFNSDPNLRLGLASTLTNVAGGPEQFFFGSLGNPTPPPTAVPEPTTMLLLGTGLAGVAARARKRRKASASEPVEKA